MDRIPTLERWRSRLPHWEVDGHWHFITIRCTGTLPSAVKGRLAEIHANLRSIDPQCEAFRQLQRKYFLSMEKYLDVGQGFAPFQITAACNSCLTALQAMETEGWQVGEATLMPNHIHLIIRRMDSTHSMKEILHRFKGRSARAANLALNRKGKFWQQDWFDRWMRHEGELLKTVNYIRNNPVKAKLCSDWSDYLWRISKL
jgi:REP element-mobilizing transposase RayT